jgi:gamma-glutamyltranspeptidase / glutathione hydrolase
MTASWRLQAETVFTCEKAPATGRRGMVTTNNPLASAAGAEILAGGGNAIDAAVACLFALTVVEPMMIGLLGGGMSHIRLADGTHTVIDAMSVCPIASRPDMYTPLHQSGPDLMETLGEENKVGARAVATPGALRGWCEAQRRFGTRELAEVMQPAIRLAEGGYRVTPYLADCIAEAAHDLARDPVIAAVFLPDGLPAPAWSRIVMPDYAATLRAVAAAGEGMLHGGALGKTVADAIEAAGGVLTLSDLEGFRTVERAPLRGTYRGHEVVALPPPSAAGVHILQMLNILEGYDIRAMGFGSADAVHLLAEVLKIAFADRSAATADPAFVAVPVDRLVSKDYAAERRAAIALDRTQDYAAGVSPGEGPHTTHVTVADALGNVVASTHTINSLFGARFMIPGTGLIPNNYMVNFDPNPGRALSIAAGKRVTTSMAPTMVLREGRLAYALGLPGGKRIFPSVMQALVNLIDHGMSLQEAVEAPRVWTEGHALEVEDVFSDPVLRALAQRGHRVQKMPHVAGGMNAIQFHPDGSLTGAACWRADGTAIGLGGGLARAGVRFWPDTARI